MRWSVVAVLLCLASGWVRSAEEPRKAQVDAATAQAYEALRREVLAIPVSAEMSVRDYVQLTGSSAQLDDLLHSAERVGGARWLDDQTVQVRLEVRGPQLTNTLLQIAARHPKAVPIPLGTLRSRLNAQIFPRTFSALGASTSGSAADRLRPADSQVAWQKVSAQDRRAAIDAARKNAVNHVLDSVMPIEWDSGKRIGQALEAPSVSNPLRDWLAGRPITSIQFQDDLEIRLALAVTPKEFWPQLRMGLEKQTAVPAPKGPAAWEQLWRQVEDRMAPAVGSAIAQAAAPATNIAVVALPNQPPAWIDTTTEAQGVAGPDGQSKLKTARAAQAIAVERLRGRLNALPLSRTMVLGEAARKDPKVEEALSRSLNHAHIAKVEYDTPAPGSVTVHISLSLQDVWDELRRP